ncbi:antibiotic biosynthesis monooxygenase [Pseudonocardia kujensis]|uniref:putative quinol monooxygenase n=1 Tax=Pseudonocardia kujensis TaxID=1128675 RepID=UPI001E42CCF9|nr:antibiotic biosynthesis monooxygenase [Pseudonocardia kujensis]MCE0767953.1 antibiotic biosynthesis monooxygenase [Pseudonocardia kujensis]
MSGGPTCYEIRVDAVLDDAWSACLDGLVATEGPAGQTVLTGPLADQAALHGALARIRDLGVPLLSVRQVRPEASMAIMIRAELRVLPGKREEFIEVARALEDAAADEPATLRYAWFTGADPHEFVVLEEYADQRAAFAHNQHCAELLRRVPTLAEMVSVHVHGALGPQLQEWIAGEPVAHGHPPLS